MITLKELGGVGGGGGGVWLKSSCSSTVANEYVLKAGCCSTGGAGGT